MILTEKNEKDVNRPRRKMFGEEWFCDPSKFNHDFFGVSLDGKRPQPFPTLDAAEKFALYHASIGMDAKVLDINGVLMRHLTPSV